MPMATAQQQPAPAATISVVVVPAGCGPGSVLQMEGPNGAPFQVSVPPGHAAGMTFHIQMPGSPLVLPGAVPPPVALPPPPVALPTTQPPPPVAVPRSAPAVPYLVDPEAPADARVSKDCCITRLDMKLRLEADLAEAEGPVQRCCVYKGFYESFLVFFATIATACLVVIQYAFVQRIQLTQGMAFPMFLEGTCVCGGALCDNVIFTLNLTDDALMWEPDPEEPETVQYWQAWNQTNLVLQGHNTAAATCVPAPDAPGDPTCAVNGAEDACRDGADDGTCIFNAANQRCTQNHNNDLCAKGCKASGGSQP